MSRSCAVCEHPNISRWEICSRIERTRGRDGGFPSFVSIKRDLQDEYGVNTSVTGLKQHVEDHVEMPAAGACLLRAQLYDESFDSVVEEVSQDVSPIELIEFLPDRPLTEAEVGTIASHPEIDAIHGEPLTTWYSTIPDDFEDDIHAFWIETGYEIISFSLYIGEFSQWDQYTASMNADQEIRWEQMEIRKKEDLVDRGMMYRNDYLHVPEQKPEETETPAFSEEARADTEDWFTDRAVQPSSAVMEREFAGGQPLSMDAVRDLSTEELVQQLRGFGVEISKETFQEEVEGFYSASELADHWWEVYSVTAVGYDEDFIWMAAVVLWERLVPDAVSSEQLDRMMQDGYDLRDEGKTVEACNLWLEVWKHLKERFTEEMTSIRDAEQVFSGLQSLYNWCQDVEMELGNAGRQDDSAFHEKRIEYCREFCELFPETYTLIIQNMRSAVAVSLFDLGRVNEGEAGFEALVSEYPDFVWGYTKWGDKYWQNQHHDEIPLDYGKAEEIYQRALSNDIDEPDVVRKRLKKLETERENRDSEET
ncbi:hypothetical protein GCM10008985_12740 [Halococcus dombrowskii]|uniref:Uncharacterized protein n=2 Tax=Halococcus dombrowskii TaxID=179637 RepID=A0AAV3SEG8_HALDO